MEVIGFFKRLLQKKAEISPELQRQKELIRQRVQFEQEELARKRLFELYTKRESTLADAIAANQKMVPGGNVNMRRVGYDAGNWAINATGGVLEAGEVNILSIVNNPERRRSLQLEALDSAKSYWEQTLDKPDQSTNVMMLGRRRLTQISGKLEKLTNPPQSNNSQP